MNSARRPHAHLPTLAFAISAEISPFFSRFCHFRVSVLLSSCLWLLAVLGVVAFVASVRVLSRLLGICRFCPTRHRCLVLSPVFYFILKRNINVWGFSIGSLSESGPEIPLGRPFWQERSLLSVLLFNWAKRDCSQERVLGSPPPHTNFAVWFSSIVDLGQTTKSYH